jgi:hypothetical protein
VIFWKISVLFELPMREHDVLTSNRTIDLEHVFDSFNTGPIKVRAVALSSYHMTICESWKSGSSLDFHLPG